MDENERQGKDETEKNVEIFLCVVVVGDSASVVVVGVRRRNKSWAWLFFHAFHGSIRVKGSLWVQNT